MKATLLLLLIVLSFAEVCVSQKEAKRRELVIWSADANCHAANRDEVKAAKPECSRVDVSGTTFYILSYKGVSYAFSQRQTDRFVISSVQISNKTNSALEPTPYRSRLLRYESVKSLVDAGKPAADAQALSKESLRQTSYDELPTSEQDGGIRPGLQVQTIYEQRITGNGTIVRDRARLEPKAPPTERAGRGRLSTGLMVTRSVFDYVLTLKTLASQEKAAGHVVFKLPKDDGFFVFAMNVGTMDFLFPMPPSAPASVK